MSILNRIADGFVQAFGITAPAPEKRRTAAIFITALLGGVLLFFALIAGFLLLRILR